MTTKSKSAGATPKAGVKAQRMAGFTGRQPRTAAEKAAGARTAQKSTTPVKGEGRDRATAGGDAPAGPVAGSTAHRAATAHRLTGAAGAGEPEGGLMRFRLLRGKHIGPNFRENPDPQTGKRPSRIYFKGQVVVDDVDLEKLHGQGKFLRLGEPVPEIPCPPVTTQGTSAPNGQVGSGFQVLYGNLPENKDPRAVEDDDFADLVDGEPAYYTPNMGSEGLKSRTEAASEAKSAGATEEGGEGEKASSAGKAEAGHPTEEQFQGMTVAELHDYAGKNDVDVKGIHLKDDLVKTMMDHHKKAAK